MKYVTVPFNALPMSDKKNVLPARHDQGEISSGSEFQQGTVAVYGQSGVGKRCL
jgi:hypothetical protein